jgi:hypothetical protein
MTDAHMVAYELEPDDDVSCYFCLIEGEYKSYGRGEAYLCEAGCPPFDGNANYVCKGHLDSDVIVHTPTKEGKAND